jgi:hypothetical protein
MHKSLDQTVVLCYSKMWNHMIIPISRETGRNKRITHT